MRLREQFDLQAHRGGRGLIVESILPTFANALTVGVSTLECDIHVSIDGVPMVVHDRRLSAKLYDDTEPAVEGDPFFPYVGGLVTDYSVAQLRTIDAGSHHRPELPDAALVPGARIPLLSELFDLVADRGADEVRFNIETKFDAVAPHETAPRERFAETIVAAAQQAGLVDRISVQSFDWEVLRQVRQREPGLQLNVLAAPKYLAVGHGGPSPWLGGVDLDDFPDLVAAVAAERFDAISPAHGYPFASGVTDPAYQPFTTPGLIDRAHAEGLLVIPYTLNDPATAAALIDQGVDGLITDFPDRIRAVLGGLGLSLPQPHPGAPPGQTLMTDVGAI